MMLPTKTYDELKDIMVPITIFGNRELGALEALTKYLREEHKLRNREVAVILNRDDRTVWTVYNRSQIKTGTAPKVKKRKVTAKKKVVKKK